MLIDRRRQGIVLTALLLLLYGLFARTYWVAIVLAWVGTLWLITRSRRRAWVLFIAVTATVLIVVAWITLVQGYPLDYYRDGSNVIRIPSGDADTAIRSPLSGTDGFPLGLASYLITALALLVPVPLAFIGPQYAVYAVAIITIWLFHIRTGIALLRGSTGERDRRRAWTLALWLLPVFVFLVLVAFEPDYGSYLRHLTPMLPLMLLSREELSIAAGAADRVIEPCCPRLRDGLSRSRR
jgi:hypothetical protein